MSAPRYVSPRLAAWLGAELRAARRDSGYSAEWLAGALRVGGKRLLAYERGEHGLPELALLLEWCELLEICPGDLVRHLDDERGAAPRLELVQ